MPGDSTSAAITKRRSACFKEIIAADPSNVQNHVTLAVIYMAEKDTKDAIAELNVIAGP